MDTRARMRGGACGRQRPTGCTHTHKARTTEQSGWHWSVAACPRVGEYQAREESTARTLDEGDDI